MKRNQHHLLSGILAAAVMAATPFTQAQTVSGTPGSPCSTVTLDGEQLPPPPMPFGGVIKEAAKDSKPYWPARVVPPKSAPNELLIMTDDQDHGVSTTFGGVIPTPSLNRIANAGLRFTRFHSTAVCSPTRASLISGRNHPTMGFEYFCGFMGDETDRFTSILFRDYRRITPWIGQKNYNLITDMADEAINPTHENKFQI